MRKIIYIFIWAMGCIGCQDYLSINPDSSLEVKIDSEEKIAELLTAAYPTASYCSFFGGSHRQCSRTHKRRTYPPQRGYVLLGGL